MSVGSITGVGADGEFNFVLGYKARVPEGLGALLAVLLQSPREFEVNSEKSAQAERYSAAQSRSFQQYAIEVILVAIVENARAVSSIIKW